MVKSYRFVGIRVDDITMSEVISHVKNAMQSHRALNIVTINPELAMTAKNNPAFKQIIEAADIVTPDGAGMVVIGKLTKRPLRERVTGVDICYELAQLCASTGHKLYLLGAPPGVAEQAAVKLRQAHPKLQVVADQGNPTPQEEPDILARISAAQPDILLVAYGSPKQELWIQQQLPKLKPMVTIGVGGSFDFIAGTAKRAPKFMQNIHLEWFWRLIMQPWRLRRMLVLIPFGLQTLGEAVFKRR